jgi:hypothetical protein
VQSAGQLVSAGGYLDTRTRTVDVPSVNSALIS